MGPSGSGKSTLLSILGLLDGSWTGEYWFFDQPVHKMNTRQRADLNKQYMGFVFQSYHLIDGLTVAENLDMPLSYRDIKKSERAAMVADTLDRFHMGRKEGSVPQSTLWRPAAVGCSGARGDRQPEGNSSRRTHRQSALETRPGNHGVVQEAQTMRARRSFRSRIPRRMRNTAIGPFFWKTVGWFVPRRKR